LTMLALFVLGYLMQKYIINTVMLSSSLTTFLLTFGFETLLINLALRFWTANTRQSRPSYANESMALGQLRLPYTQLAAFVVVLLPVPLYFICLPLLCANPVVVALAPSVPGAVVQAQYSPALCSGLDHLLEDADDIGRMQMGDMTVTFIGDRSRFTLSPSDVESIDWPGAGWRVWWLTGRKARLNLRERMDGIQAVTIGIREGYFLWSQRKASRKLRSELTQWIVPTA